MFWKRMGDSMGGGGWKGRGKNEKLKKLKFQKAATWQE